jgi:hypothetical protein
MERANALLPHHLKEIDRSITSVGRAGWED